MSGIRPLPALTAVLSATLLVGCAGLAQDLSRPWIAPEVQVISLTPKTIEADRQSLAVGLRIENPNDRTLPIKAMTYRLALEGQPVASGGGALERQIPAFGTTEAEVSLDTSLASLLPLLPTLALANRPLRYRIEGTATVAGIIPLPYRHEGEIDAAALVNRALRR